MVRTDLVLQPLWKYVRPRRYFAFLEHSFDRGTEWAVLEPNEKQRWRTRRAVG